MGDAAAGLRATRDDRRGVAAVEFALVATVLITLLLGVFDIGTAVHERLLLQQALRSGGQYAMSYPDQIGDIDAPNNGVAQVIAQALPASWSRLTTVTLASDRGGGSYYITLTASRPYSPMLPLLRSVLRENSASYVVRVK